MSGHWDDPKAGRLVKLVGQIGHASRVMNAVTAVASILLILGALGFVLLSWARGKVAARTATRKEGTGASASVS